MPWCVASDPPRRGIDASRLPDDLDTQWHPTQIVRGHGQAAVAGQPGQSLPGLGVLRFVSLGTNHVHHGLTDPVIRPS